MLHLEPRTSRPVLVEPRAHNEAYREFLDFASIQTPNSHSHNIRSKMIVHWSTLYSNLSKPTYNVYNMSIWHHHINCPWFNNVLTEHILSACLVMHKALHLRYCTSMLLLMRRWIWYYIYIHLTYRCEENNIHAIYQITIDIIILGFVLLQWQWTCYPYLRL